MKNQSMKIKTIMAGVLTILFLIGGSARANASGGDACSPAKIRGSYAYTAIGSLSPSADVPIAAVGVLTIDEDGNVSGHDTVSGLGQSVSRTFSGTLTLTPECTATATLNFTGAPFDGGVVVNFVFEDRARSMRGIQIVPVGPVLTVSGRKM